jgi:hypothetical protein
MPCPAQVERPEDVFTWTPTLASFSAGAYVVNDAG